ncbi:MAG: CopD family protein [Bauldia sp.]
MTEPENRHDAGIALRRFSTTGHVVVALIVASGIVNTWLVLGRVPSDWSSPYQALLAVKIALVAVMVGLAVLNRYAFVPAMARDRSRAVRAIRWGTIAEVSLGVCVVALVAVFGMLDPLPM